MASLEKVVGVNADFSDPRAKAPGIAGSQQAAFKTAMENIPKSSGGFASKLQGLNSGLGGSMLGGIGAAGGDMIASLGSAIGNKYGEDFSDEQKATQSAIRKGLAMIPGYGQIIAAATGVVDAIGTATGTNLSNLNKDSAGRAGIGGAAAFNNMMNSLPGNSMLWGIWGSRTDKYKMSDQAEEMSGGYSGTVGDLRAAQDIANKRLLFDQGVANQYIEEQKEKDKLLVNINHTNTVRKQSDYYQDLQNQNINRYAGQNYLGTRVGKQGMKLISVEEARRIIALRKVAETEDVEKFQNGGVIGIDTNILPEGALHKEKHHLEEINPELEDVTKKGIPVVESTENQQVAEIERDELIFRLEVTKKLEELMKDGSEEAMIEAGKIAATEIIENTQDNTGQITEENDGKE